MKKLILCLTFTALMIASYSQAPTAFNYQAILRNTDGTVKADETVSIQIDIVNDKGISSYLEMHSSQTSEFGLVNLVIGEGSTSDDLSTVDWANGPYFIDISVNGANMGSSPLLSVPYALHSNTADSLIGVITESDPIYISSVASGISELDTTSWNNKLDSYTETQNLSDVLTISNNSNGNQIKNIGNPTDNQDAVTKSYTTLRVSLEGDSLFMGSDQWVIIPGISDANDTINYTSDVEGNRYKVIKIGSQIWMAENLKVTSYSDGTPIPLVEDMLSWNSLNNNSKAFCWYNNDIQLGETFGALYTWGAVMNGEESTDLIPSGVQGVCQKGWHVPSDSEWKELEIYLGMSPAIANDTLWRGSNEGGALKTPGTSIWTPPNLEATNSSGFSAMPGGYRYADGTFAHVYDYAVFWTATDNTSDYAWQRGVRYDQSGIRRSNKVYGAMSVRCVKD